MTLAGVYLRALGIGLLVAAPVGAMALRCIERTLARGRAAGYATGAGIATADALYGSVAAFGLTALSGLLTGAQGWVRLIGGAFLVYLGVRAMLARPASCATAPAGSHAGAYGSAVLLTLANPQTIMMFAGIFAGAGLAFSHGGWAAPGVTVAGVFSGSLLWWVALVSAVAALRDRVGERVVLWVTRASGAAIAVFGVLAVWAGIATLVG